MALFRQGNVQLTCIERYHFVLIKSIIDIQDSQAICKTAKEIVDPIIAEQIPQYKIESVEFQSFTLGTLPPTFPG